MVSQNLSAQNSFKLTYLLSESVGDSVTTWMDSFNSVKVLFITIKMIDVGEIFYIFIIINIDVTLKEF